MREPRIFLSSNFDEFRDLRAQLSDFMVQWLQDEVVVYNLDDSRARVRSPLHESLLKVTESDLLVLIIGSNYGGVPDGGTLSFAHQEWLKAQEESIPVLAFVGEDDGSVDERVRQWREDVAKVCTFGPLTGEAIIDVQSVVGAINEWLAERAEVVVNDQSDDAGEYRLGRRLHIANGFDWRDDRINRLDIDVFGRLTPRSGSPAMTMDLAAQNEWNEACKALQAGHSASALAHLERVVDYRRNDGEARYWMARLVLATATTESDYVHVAAEAGDAARVLADIAGNARAAGLALLIRAKALRRLGRYHQASTDAAAAVEGPLGAHSESHLEHALATAAVGSLDASRISVRQAFIRYPSSLPAFKRELRRIPEVPEGVYDNVIGQLVIELREQVTTMIEFRAELRGLKSGSRHRSLQQLQRSNDPVELARGCQSLAAESLSLLQNAEADGWSRSIGVDRAAAMHIEDRRKDVTSAAHQRLWQVLVAAAVLCFVGPLALFATSQSQGIALVSFLVLVAVAVATMQTVVSQGRADMASARHDFRVAAENVEVARSRAQNELGQWARSFVELVDRYERDHLYWRLYSPERSREADKNRQYLRMDRTNPDVPRFSDDALRPDIRKNIGPAFVGADSSNRARFGLYIVDDSRGTRTASRWPAYCAEEELIDLGDDRRPHPDIFVINPLTGQSEVSSIRSYSFDAPGTQGWNRPTGP